MKKAWGIAFACFATFCGLGCERIVLNFEGTEASFEGNAEGGTGSDLEDPLTAELTVSDSFNLSRENLPGRACPDGGEAVSYRVMSFADASLQLEQAASPGCIQAGDEVLLIELQGNPTSTDRVGRHELLRVGGVRNEELELVALPTQSFGVGSKDAWESHDSTVLVQRVPTYARLRVQEGAELTSASWNEGGSGVLAVRALGDMVIDGKITMTGGGYRGGTEQPEALALGHQGESIAGTGTRSTSPNRGGGGGGLGDQTLSGCVQDGNAGGGGGHKQSGETASVNDLCAGLGAGLGGESYARTGKLFLGSGGGSGGMDNVTRDNPPGAAGGNGGGIIWLLAQSVSGRGVIESRGEPGAGDPEGNECESSPSTVSCYDHSGPGGGGAGGTVRLSSPRVSGVAVDVNGGAGGNGFDTAGGNGGSGSPGVIDPTET